MVWKMDTLMELEKERLMDERKAARMDWMMVDCWVEV
jgi:hypothetical protein